MSRAANRIASIQQSQTNEETTPRPPSQLRPGTTLAETEGLTCSVCLELFQSPRQLPGCQHTFCLDCLEQLDREVVDGYQPRNHPNIPVSTTENQRDETRPKLVIRCPYCRAVSELNAQRGPSDFKVDEIMETKVKNFRDIFNLKAPTPRPNQRRRAPRILNRMGGRNAHLLPPEFAVEMPDEIARDFCRHCCDLFMAGPTCCHGRCICFSGLTALGLIFVALTGAVIIPLMIVLDSTNSRPLFTSSDECLEFQQVVKLTNGSWSTKNLHNCKSYYVVENKFDWLEANKACQYSDNVKSGDIAGLATIQTETDHRNAVQFFQSLNSLDPAGYWIGLGPMMNVDNVSVFEWYFPGFQGNFLIVGYEYYLVWGAGQPVITHDNFYPTNNTDGELAGNTNYQRVCVYYRTIDFKWATSPCSISKSGVEARYPALCQRVFRKSKK